MKQKSLFPALVSLLLIGSLAFCGCTSQGGFIPEIPGQGNTGGSLQPGPVQTLPPESTVEIQINEKDTSYATIQVIFAGGKGQIAVTSILVQVTRPDGQVITRTLPAEKGAEVKIQGSKDTDRIEVFVSLNTGKTYKIIDRLLPYRTRG
jgi:hypothetical protein